MTRAGRVLGTSIGRQAWELDESALSGRTNTIVTIRMANASGWGSWAGVGDC